MYDCISYFHCHFFYLEWIIASFFFLFNFLWVLILPTSYNSSVKCLPVQCSTWSSSQIIYQFLFFFLFLQPLLPAPGCTIFTWPEAQLLLWQCLLPLSIGHPCISWLIPLFWWGIPWSGLLRKVLQKRIFTLCVSEWTNSL